MIAYIMGKRKRIKSPWPAALKLLREKNGLTQAAAAEKVGVALRTWINWENEYAIPSQSVAILLRMLYPKSVLPKDL